MNHLDNCYNDDGTVTYWSIYNQVWVDHADFVPDRELAAMSESESEQVAAHLAAHLAGAIRLEGV